MYSELQSLLLTLEDRNILIQEIGVVSQVVFVTDDQKKEEIMKSGLRSNVIDIWRKFLSDHQLEDKEWLALKQEIMKLPVIQLTVAVPVNQDLLEQISNTLRQRAELSQVLLDVQHDPNILGGVVILKNGKIADFSVKKGIKEYLAQRSDQVTTSLFSNSHH